MDVSIIIINFNSSEYTSGCVDSIFQYTTGLEFEIIVVDNNSEPDDVDALEGLLHGRNVLLIKSKSNLGFGGGNLLGYHFATGDFLFENALEFLFEVVVVVISGVIIVVRVFR